MTRQPRVPVTIITGFLGVGKTTAIRHLLAGNQTGQRWAVLVNEFGEVGIDGPTLGDSGLSVHEIPGGCICCTSGIAMQVSLVRMLRDVKPDRVIIEPTGLAHPANVLDLLRKPGIAEAVDVRATITLVDPRHLGDERVRSSTNFNDQVTVADVIVANKMDLCSPNDTEQFHAFIADLWPQPVLIDQTEQGQLDPEWLDLDPRPNTTHKYTPAPQVHLLGAGLQAEPTAPSMGWIWPPDRVFDQGQLRLALQDLVRPGPIMSAGVLRTKGLFRTRRAWLLAQADPDAVRFEPTGWRRDSRVEIIAPVGTEPDWEAVRDHLEGALV